MPCTRALATRSEAATRAAEAERQEKIRKRKEAAAKNKGRKNKGRTTMSRSPSPERGRAGGKNGSKPGDKESKEEEQKKEVPLDTRVMIDTVPAYRGEYDNEDLRWLQERLRCAREVLRRYVKEERAEHGRACLLGSWQQMEPSPLATGVTALRWRREMDAVSVTAVLASQNATYDLKVEAYDPRTGSVRSGLVPAPVLGYLLGRRTYSATFHKALLEANSAASTAAAALAATGRPPSTPSKDQNQGQDEQTATSCVGVDGQIFASPLPLERVEHERLLKAVAKHRLVRVSSREGELDCVSVGSLVLMAEEAAAQAKKAKQAREAGEEGEEAKDGSLDGGALPVGIEGIVAWPEDGELATGFDYRPLEDKQRLRAALTEPICEALGTGENAGVGAWAVWRCVSGRNLCSTALLLQGREDPLHKLEGSALRPMVFAGGVAEREEDEALDIAMGGKGDGSLSLGLWNMTPQEIRSHRTEFLAKMKERGKRMQAGGVNFKAIAANQGGMVRVQAVHPNELEIKLVSAKDLLAMDVASSGFFRKRKGKGKGKGKEAPTGDTSDPAATFKCGPVSQISSNQPTKPRFDDTSELTLHICSLFLLSRSCNFSSIWRRPSARRLLPP